MRTVPIRRGVAAAAAIAALGVGALAGCSSTPPAATGATTSATAPVDAEHNPADVTFARAMLPHHAQAVAMAALAPTRAASAQVTDLARRIEGAQGPEIEQINAMLVGWGAPPLSPDAPAMPGMEAGGGMPGTMSDGQMSQLGAMSGPSFDRTFLTMMIGHHAGAISMARTELAQGLNPQARALAGSIIAAQQREITEMRALLG